MALFGVLFMLVDDIDTIVPLLALQYGMEVV